VAVKAKCDGTTLEAWVAGTLEVTDTDSDLAAGAVALGGESPKFDDLKVGYDVNDDDDIDDAGDNLVIDETFGSTDVTVSHCDAGNLIDDGHLVNVYDALALDSRPRLSPLCFAQCRVVAAGCQGCEPAG